MLHHVLPGGKVVGPTGEALTDAELTKLSDADIKFLEDNGINPDVEPKKFSIKDQKFLKDNGIESSWQTLEDNKVNQESAGQENKDYITDNNNAGTIPIPEPVNNSFSIPYSDLQAGLRQGVIERSLRAAGIPPHMIGPGDIEAVMELLDSNENGVIMTDGEILEPGHLRDILIGNEKFKHLENAISNSEHNEYNSIILLSDQEYELLIAKRMEEKRNKEAMQALAAHDYAIENSTLATTAAKSKEEPEHTKDPRLEGIMASFKKYGIFAEDYDRTPVPDNTPATVISVEKHIGNDFNRN